jgi:hypothetical protein
MLVNDLQNTNVPKNVPRFTIFGCFLRGKGKAIPLQAWTSPEGSRRLRLPDFMTIDT